MFNEQTHFETVILPKIKELIDLCADRDIPLLVAACFSIEPAGDDGEQVGICKAGCFPLNRTPAQMALAACALEATDDQAVAAHAVLHGGELTDQQAEEFAARVEAEVDKVVEKIMSRFN